MNVQSASGRSLGMTRRSACDHLGTSPPRSHQLGVIQGRSDDDEQGDHPGREEHNAVRRACGGVLILDTGEFIDRGRLWWGTEGTCQTCPVAWCEQDSGDETPEEIRQALFAEHGPARLRLTEPEVGLVPVLRALRKVHGLSLAQARATSDELRTIGLVGTLVEMELIAARLRHHSVAARVEKCLADGRSEQHTTGV
jgi:hypothetical protein